jgi:hypothetical protein
MIKLTYEIKGKEYDYAQFQTEDILYHFIRAIKNRGARIVKVEGLEIEEDRKQISSGE